MFRHSLVVLAGLWAAGAASAATWADSMFEELSRDFGSVPRGPTLSHPFTFKNKTGQTVHVASVRVSCGCVTASALKTELAPGESTAIQADMDTRRFNGAKTVTIFVQFDRPQWEEVRLWVQANSRDDMNLTPESLNFGQVRRGGTPSVAVKVTFYGNGGWEITEGKCDSNYVVPKIKELNRTDNEVTYEVKAALRNDTPVGRWYTDVWLMTTNPNMPKVRVPLMVEIESALSVTPTVANLGVIKMGAEAERKVIVRGVKAFTIKEIKGADGVLSVKESNPGSKAVHVLTVKYKPKAAAELERTLRVLTDMKEDGEIDFQAVARVSEE